MTNMIKMTWAQLKLGAEAGVMRRLSAIFADRSRRGGEDDKGDYETDIVSCQSELAVSLFFNLSWCGALGNLKAKDVGGFLQVRAITKSHHKLILHPEDLDDDPFVLVLCSGCQFHILGWSTAKDGKLAKFWDDPTGKMPAFFVPQIHLDKVSNLRLLINARLHAPSDVAVEPLARSILLPVALGPGP